MPFLHDLKGIFTRRKPVVVDLTTSQAAGLTKVADTQVEAKIPLSIKSEVEEAINEKKASAGKFKGAGAPSTIQNLDEVMSMVRRISSHLEGQTTRTDRMVECMEKLPASLDALPEINRQNTRLLEVVTEYLGHARHRDDALNQTLNEITTASGRQTDVLGLLQQQLDSNSRSTETLVSNLSDFREVLSQLANSNSQTTKVLNNIHRSNEHRESALTLMLGRTQKWMIVAMICCAAAAVTAVIVAGMTLLN